MTREDKLKLVEAILDDVAIKWEAKYAAHGYPTLFADPESATRSWNRPPLAVVGNDVHVSQMMLDVLLDDVAEDVVVGTWRQLMSLYKKRVPVKKLRDCITSSGVKLKPLDPTCPQALLTQYLAVCARGRTLVVTDNEVALRGKYGNSLSVSREYARLNRSFAFRPVRVFLPDVWVLGLRERVLRPNPRLATVCAYMESKHPETAPEVKFMSACAVQFKLSMRLTRVFDVELDYDDLDHENPPQEVLDWVEQSDTNPILQLQKSLVPKFISFKEFQSTFGYANRKSGRGYSDTQRERHRTAILNLWPDIRNFERPDPSKRKVDALSLFGIRS